MLEALAESRVVGLVGPRQSGKSTLARDIIAPRWKAEYHTLDDEGTREAAREDPTGFVERIRGSAIIDEIQRAPDLMLTIKARVDRSNEPGQFLITGSANLQRIAKVQDSLPGRVDYIPLWPLSQAEIEHGSDGLLNDLLLGSIPDRRGAVIGSASYLERFAAGGFPGVFRRSNSARRRFFDGYVEAIVERDVADLIHLRAPEGPGKLLRLVAGRSAGLLNASSLARDLQVSEKTVASHFKILEDLMLVRRHPPWFANLGSRETKSPKAYVADAGLMATLVGASAAGIETNPTLTGSFLETAVVMELVRLAATADEHVGFFHYRDNKQREVDLILERPDRSIVGIEVKAGASASRRDFGTLAYLRDRLGTRFTAGIVFNTGEQTLLFGDRLAAVPIAALWTPDQP